MRWLARRDLDPADGADTVSLDELGAQDRLLRPTLTLLLSVSVLPNERLAAWT